MRRLQEDCESQKRKVARWLREKSAGLALRLPWAGGLEDSRCTCPTRSLPPVPSLHRALHASANRIQEAEHVRATDRADAFLFLQLLDAAAEFFHLGPMHLGTEMVLRMITVVEKQPVINFSVAADSPRNRLVRVGPVMAIVSVQITETMAEIPEWQEKQNESPVDEVNWMRRNDYGHHQKRRCERSQLDFAPEIIVVVCVFPILFGSHPHHRGRNLRKHSSTDFPLRHHLRDDRSTANRWCLHFHPADPSFPCDAAYAPRRTSFAKNTGDGLRGLQTADLSSPERKNGL